jgi:replicative DNA helicase
MTKKQIQEKLIGMAIGCNPRQVAQKVSDKNDTATIKKVGDYLSNTSLEILRPNGARADINILLYYMRKKAKEGVEVFFIDQLSFIRHGDSKMPYHLQVDEIVRAIKAEAISLNVIVVLAHQLIQETKRSGKTNFDLSDLKSSSGVGETLDDAIFLRREEDTDDVAIMWRGRNGSGDTSMKYDSRLAVFTKNHYELR